MTLEQFKNLKFFHNTDTDWSNFIDTSDNHTMILDYVLFDGLLNVFSREMQADFYVYFTEGERYLIFTKVAGFLISNISMSDWAMAQLLGENQIEGLYNLCLMFKTDAEEHKAKIIKKIKEL